MELEISLLFSQEPANSEVTFRNTLVFYGENLLPHP
jgi:hypothetical protein